MLRPDGTTITDESAVALAASIRAREVSARAVIDAHIAVLERFAPATNAVVVDCYDSRGTHGLPLGVRVVAGPDRDHLSIAAALTLERAFGGWVRPRK